ncbi:MAG: response regulator [Elusimicrobiota bacterium]|nr:response regulator [Elusimicrobiota bacterium]
MAPKILVVDDDADTRRVLRYVLETVAQIVEAEGGAQALLRIKSERPQLVLLDLVMPEVGGLEVLVSALKDDPTLKIIVLTGQSDIGVARSALERGARAFITKPIDPERLRDVVEDFLNPNGGRGDAEGRKPWRVVG